MNLADVEPPDFFSVDEIESVDDQISQVPLHRYLKALSGELRKPVRVSDQATDYIPTQYLCELAKSLGIDGVLYTSSLDAGGGNVVLFDVDAAACVEPPRLIEVTSLKAEWKYVDQKLRNARVTSAGVRAATPGRPASQRSPVSFGGALAGSQRANGAHKAPTAQPKSRDCSRR